MHCTYRRLDTMYKSKLFGTGTRACPIQKQETSKNMIIL